MSILDEVALTGNCYSLLCSNCLVELFGRTFSGGKYGIMFNAGVGIDVGSRGGSCGGRMVCSLEMRQ